MNTKKFEYYPIFTSSIHRALSGHKYNLIGSLKNQEDKPKRSHGRLLKLFIKKL